MSEKIEFFMCHCGSEAIGIQTLDSEPLIYFSIWRYAVTKPYGWRVKLRWIWDILTKGDFNSDQIVLDKVTAFALGTHLIAQSGVTTSGYAETKTGNPNTASYHFTY